MKRSLVLCLVAGVSFAAGRVFNGIPATAAAVGGQGNGGAEKCAAKNGDVNADGKVDLADAVTILGYLFLGNPTDLVGFCAPPELETCQTDLATAQAALASSQEKLAQCQAGKTLALPDTGQTACSGLDDNQRYWVEVPCDQATCPGQDGFYATGCANEGRFLDNGDGTVTDHCTGLMWQRDMADVDGDGQTPDDLSDARAWCGTLAYCDSLNFAGHDDWRLPNVRELQSIVDYGRHNPSIDPVFSGLSSVYWSSTSCAGSPGVAWYVVFRDGNVGMDLGDGVGYVRAVRNAP